MIPSLWALFWKRRKCLSKVILTSKVTPNITRSSNSLRTVPSRVNGVDWRWILRDLMTIIAQVLLAFNLIHSPQVTPLINHVKITIQVFCNSYSFIRGWHNSKQSEFASITVKLVFQYGEISAVYWRNKCGPKERKKERKRKKIYSN